MHVHPRLRRRGNGSLGRFCATFLLPLLLLLSQQGLLLHEIGHLAAAESSGPARKPAGVETCLVCLAYAQADAAVQPGVVAPALLSDLAYALAPAAAFEPGSSPACTPRSRGPPTVL